MRRVPAGATIALCLALALLGCGAAEPQPQESSRAPQMQDEEDEIQLSEPAPGETGEETGEEGLPQPEPAPEGGGACETDEDCVPASCCHPTVCVLRSETPDCSATMCTRDCQANTLDCGGSCLCRDGQCAAQFARVR